MQQKPTAAASNANQPTENHDRRKRPAINGGAFHQRADGLQIFFCPVRFHGITLHCKVYFGQAVYFGPRWQSAAATAFWGNRRADFSKRRRASLAAAVQKPRPELSVFIRVHLWLISGAMPPPKKIPPLGPGKRSARQRVLAQWRGVDLAPLEKARAVPARSADEIFPRS